MDLNLGAWIPAPRLINIRPPRPLSVNSVKDYSYSISDASKSQMNINPALLPHRRTSRSRNHGAVGTVPEMRRFSADTSLGTRSKSQYGNGQRLGTSGSLSPPTERESMRDLANFLMYHPPPTRTSQSFTQESSKKKFGLFGKKAKKGHTQNELLRLPDTAVAARTGKGVQYIAISIPIQHDYLGNLTKTGCPTPPESVSETRSPSSGNEKEPIVVHKPVYKPKSRNITPPPDLQRPRNTDSRSTIHSRVPRLAHNKGGLQEAGSNATISLSGYFQYNKKCSPPTSISAVEPHSLPGRSNTLTSSQVRRTSFQDTQRTQSLRSIHHLTAVPTYERKGLLKVVNRTPSPHIKSVHQSHQESKSLKSTPDSCASSIAATVLGTVETVDLQSIKAETSLPALSPAESSNLTLAAGRSHATTISTTTPPIPQISNEFVNRVQSNGSDHRPENSSRTSRRGRVRARKEKDLAELISRNTPSPDEPIAAPTHTHTRSGSFGTIATLKPPRFWTASGERRVVTKPLDHQAGLSSIHRLHLDGSRSSPDLTRSAKHHGSSNHHHSKSMKNLASNTSKTIALSRIMVVADLPPSPDHLSPVDLGLPIPTPKRSLKSLGKIAYSHNTTQTLSTSQTYTQTPPLPPPPPTPVTKLSHRRLRPNSAPSNTPFFLDLTREDLEPSISVREHELDARLSLVERNTDVLRHTLGAIARGLEEVADHPADDGDLRRQKSAATARTNRTHRTSKTDRTSKTHRTSRTGTMSSSRRKRETEERDGERDMMEPVMREIQMLAPRVSEESLGGRVDETLEDDRISL